MAPPADRSENRAVLSALIVERIKAKGTWITAGIVGTFINIYGQLLVPWLRGAEPVPAFMNELETNPGVSALSILLGYAFPVLVGVYSSVNSRWEHRHYELRAILPDREPDPVFRADPSGQIVDSGDHTVAPSMIKSDEERTSGNS